MDSHRMKVANEYPVFAVLLVPSFGLQSVRRHAAATEERSPDLRAVLVDDSHREGRILECTPAARREGVSVGMTSSQAVARCPNLRLFPQDLRQESVAQQILLEAAWMLSPLVESSAPGICTADLQNHPQREVLMETSSSSRDTPFFLPALRHLRDMQLTARAGAARNALLARLAAQHRRIVPEARSFLDPLPVGECDPSPTLARLLSDWGIHTCGEFTRLPFAEVRDRLGAEAESLWLRAAGRAEKALQFVQPAEVFEETCEFESPTELLDPILFMIRRFLEQLSRRVSSQSRVVGALQLSLPLEDGTSYVRDFTIPSPTAEVGVLFRILETHFENFRLEHRPTGVRLGAKPVRPARDQLQLFETSLRDPNRFGETLARLKALAGEGRVGIPKRKSTHRPDSYEVEDPHFTHFPDTVVREDDLLPGLPLRRCRPPRPAQVEHREQTPVSLSSSMGNGILTRVMGPYRLSGDWWQAPWSVEEWDVALPNGSLLRISRRQEDWFIEGIYV